jgi:DNA polymerase
VTEPASVAAGLGTWQALTDSVCRCVACPQLVACRTRVVPGIAPAGADLLLVGEAPGAQEDATGTPFVGRAGQLLDSLLAEAGLPRPRVAVANVLKCRPPGNRKPTRAEIATCRPWLARQIELLDPVLIVTLGGTAAEWALGAGTKISAVRGTVRRYEQWPVVCTYHPSAAIRFGPGGGPMAALREDLAAAAALAARLRADRLDAEHSGRESPDAAHPADHPDPAHPGSARLDAEQPGRTEALRPRPEAGR